MEEAHGRNSGKGERIEALTYNRRTPTPITEVEKSRTSAKAT
jgi:hypothetical protein